MLKRITSILNEISKIFRGKELFKDKDELFDICFNYLNQPRKEEFVFTDYGFENEKILVEDIDYYFSNVIANLIKNYVCRSLRSNLKKQVLDG